MPKFKKECIDAAAKALSHFTKEEVRDYVSKVFSRAREFDKLGGRNSLQRAIKEVNQEELQKLFENIALTEKDANKLKAASQKIINDKTTLSELILRDRSGKNQSYNIQSAQESVRGELSSTFYDNLTTEDVKFLQNSENDIDIARAKDGKSSTETARKIAEQENKLIEKSNERLVTSGAMTLSEINHARQLNTTHDKSKLLNPGVSLRKVASRAAKYTVEKAKGLWIEYIIPRLNLEETFKGTEFIDPDGKVDMAKAREKLSEIFDNIIKDKSEIFTRSMTVNEKTAIRRRSEMFFYWKSTEHWMEYNGMYGKGTYFDAVQAHIHKTGNKVGAAEIFGSNPDQMLLNLRDKEFKTNPEISTYKTYKTDLMYKHIMGHDHATKSPTVSTFFSNLRSLASTARLVNLASMSIPDIAASAAFATKFGVNYYSAFFKHFTHLFNSFPTEQRMYIAKLFKTNLDSHLGYMGKFIDANNTSQIVNKLSTGIYRTFGMKALDNGNKISSMHIMAENLANMSDNKFEELPEALRNQLLKFNFKSHEWDILRRKNRMGLFTTDNVLALSDEEVKAIHESSDKTIPLSEVQNDLFRKVHTLFDVASEAAIGQPSEFMMAFMNQGQNPGTISGELLKTLFQFKSFPVQFIDRTIIQGIRDANGAKARLQYAFNVLAFGTVLNVGSNFFGYISQGKTFPDITKMTRPQAVKFALENVMPSLGLFLKVIDENHQGRDLGMSLLSSPSTALIGNALSTVSELGIGTLTMDKHTLLGAEKSAKRVAEGLLPFSSMPFVSPFFREMMGEKAYLQPGQKQLYGK